jgi:hypothetical protein
VSRIYFHSPEGEAKVGGSERFYMGAVVDSLAVSILFGQTDLHRLANFLPNGYARDEAKRLPEHSHFCESLDTWWRVGFGDHVVYVRGKSYNVWELSLNTVMAIGSDPVRLFARLHAQCEIHCFVHGPNRDWLADIVDEGVESGLYRNSEYSQGGGPQWTNVSKLLRSSKKEPVVCSYSVCEQFPNAGIAGWDCEKFGRLSNKKRWRLALEGLYDKSGGSRLELKPEHWKEFRFGHNKDIFWLAGEVMRQPEAYEEEVVPKSPEL